MKKIVIVGAGAVGTHILYAGLLRNLSAEFLLIDANEQVEEGNVLDLRDALLFSKAKGVRGADFGDPDVSNADIFVITAGAAQKPGETRLDLLAKNRAILTSIRDSIGPMKKEAVVILVTNPVDVLTQIAQELFPLPKGQVFGTGTLLDSSRLRWRVAERIGIHPKSVSGFVLGEHGDSEFIAWSTVFAGGKPVTELLSQEERDEIDHEVRNEAYEIIEKKGATYFGIGAAAAEILAAILGDTRRIHPISASLTGEFGLSGVSLGCPALLGSKGVEKVWEINLSAAEQQKLSESAERLQGFLKG